MKMTTLGDGVSLIKEVVKSFSTVAFLMTTEYIVIITTLIFITILIFEIIESRFSIYSKSNVSQMQKSYKI